MKAKIFGAGVAVSAAVLTCLATSTPASAFPYWQEVSTSSTWSCSTPKAHRLSLNINFKTCIVRNAKNDAQAVLVVQNSGTKAAVIRGVVHHYNTGGTYAGNWDFSCLESTLNPGFTRGCFGTTYSGTRDISATSELWMNGYDAGNLSTDSWHG
ncbi:hypothetical protein ACIQMV_13515 [Streptomyces sp. NPDC091412]|uniref:hypothetical protein n=1 Tax=Streptomyces sp. NPDC091412 TaxID=3366002 RepID=UPI003804C6CD